MKTMVCIGDSLTEGTDVPVGHTWPALVSNATGLDVINSGNGRIFSTRWTSSNSYGSFNHCKGDRCQIPRGLRPPLVDVAVIVIPSVQLSIRGLKFEPDKEIGREGRF